MLGLWEAGTGPQRMRLHLAFSVDLDDLLRAPERLRVANITPLDFWENPTDEPVVFAWIARCFSVFSRPGWQFAGIPFNAARCSAIRPRDRRMESMEVGSSE